MSFKDHFSGHSADYAAHRPVYPPELFDYIAGLSPRRILAWDCATGSGQAALELARRFDHVIASDASANQIRSAAPAGNVEYRVFPAERALIDDCAADAITVAQALHWFDCGAFYAEATRVASHGCVICAWGYGLHRIGPGVDEAVGRLYHDIVGPWWPPERRHIEARYATLPFPFEEIPRPAFVMSAEWNLADLVGYLGTWSSVRGYMKDKGVDPVDLVRDQLERAWGDASKARSVSFPLFMKTGRVRV